MATSWKFFAAERTIAGPPMSMFSISSSKLHARLGRGLLEFIQVDDDDVDGRDAVLGDRRPVLRIIATVEDAAVHLGMQGLDAAVEHLGEAGERADLDGIDAGLRAAACRCLRWRRSRSPSAASARAKSTMPVLSVTLSRARRGLFTGKILKGKCIKVLVWSRTDPLVGEVVRRSRRGARQRLHQCSGGARHRAAAQRHAPAGRRQRRRVRRDGAHGRIADESHLGAIGALRRAVGTGAAAWPGLAHRSPMRSSISG